MDLLVSRVPRVVTFAMKALRAIQRQGRLDDEAFLASALPVLDQRAKAPVKTALIMLSAIFRERPDLAPGIARAAAESLAHESDDIQARGLDLLEKMNEMEGAPWGAPLAERLDDVSPMSRQRLIALASSSDAPPAGAGPPPNSAGPAISMDESIRRIEALRPEIRKLTGVDAALGAARSRDLPPPWDGRLMDFPILSGLAPVSPIESLDELMDAASHALEYVESAEEVERILDGISRMCGPGCETKTFHRRKAPLLKRISETESVGSKGLLGSWGAPSAISFLLSAWLQGSAKLSGIQSERHHPAMAGRPGDTAPGRPGDAGFIAESGQLSIDPPGQGDPSLSGVQKKGLQQNGQIRPLPAGPRPSRSGTGPIRGVPRFPGGPD
ncbi:MAG: hypothetical protein GY859_12425 [Desulfobacterales bacterium]|nr:hypothetical protein [Desulfobacterales bacterium]